MGLPLRSRRLILLQAASIIIPIPLGAVTLAVAQQMDLLGNLIKILNLAIVLPKHIFGLPLLHQVRTVPGRAVRALIAQAIACPSVTTQCAVLVKLCMCLDNSGVPNVIILFAAEP